MSDRRYRPGIAGPVLLIGLGVIFLLNNMGLLQWSVWDVVLRLWPLLLVAWGLDLLLGRRSAWGAAVALIIILALLAGGVFMMEEASLPAGNLVTVNIPIESAEEAQVTLDPALAYLRLRVEDDSNQSLLSGRAIPFNGERVEQQVERGNRSAEASVRTTGVIVMPFLRGRTDRPTWDFSLHPQVDYDLRVDVGGGKSDLFLEDLMLSALDVHNGIGQTIIHLPGHGGYAAEIDGGIGHIIIELPDDTGIRLNVDVGIGSAQVPTSFRRSGSIYVSPNYEDADQRIEVDVSLGIGSITVR